MVFATRITLAAYMASLVIGFGLFWMPNLVAEDETVVITLLGFQLSYPLFLWITARQSWSGLWRGLRTAHGIAIGLMVLILAFAWLSTPDVSGFRN